MGRKKIERVCIVFDLENIEISLQDSYGLSLTDKGIQKIISESNIYGTVENCDFFIGAYWDRFKKHKMLSSKIGATIVDVPINTKNSADCALIIEVMKLKINKRMDKINTFVIVAGDGGYGALITYLIQINKRVVIYSVSTSSKSDLLNLVNDKKRIEEILEIKNKDSFNPKYTIKYQKTPAIESIINKARALKTRMPYLDKNYFIKEVYKASTKHPPFYPYDTFSKCSKLIEECLELGIFISDSRTTKEGKNCITLELDETHSFIREDAV